MQLQTVHVINIVKELLKMSPSLIKHGRRRQLSPPPIAAGRRPQPSPQAARPE